MQTDLYDKVWKFGWSDMKRFSPVGRRTRRWVLKLLQQVRHPESIADIGCGDGSLLKRIRCLYPNAPVFGSDLSTYA